MRELINRGIDRKELVGPLLDQYNVVTTMIFTLTARNNFFPVDRLSNNICIKETVLPMYYPYLP